MSRPMLIPEASYGSDEVGLVCGYLLEPGKPGRALVAEEALEQASAGDASGSGRFLWLHFNLANAAAEPWLKRNLRLPEAFTSSLHEGVASTRVEQDGSSLLAVVNDVH